MISKIRFADKAISAAGGLIFFQDLIEKTGLEYLASAGLPTPKIKSKINSFEKFKSLVLGLIQGAECLDDMRSCHADPVFSELCGEELSPTSYGNFLRSFDKPMITKLATSLTDHAAILHKKLRAGNTMAG